MSQKKIHARGFTDNVAESRAARVGFKKYLRELEEQFSDDFDDEDDSGFELSEQELVAEGIFSTLQSSVNAVKSYAKNLSAALATHKELKSLDGKKVHTTDELKQEAIRLRKEMMDIIGSSSPQMKKLIDAAVQKMGAAPLHGAYTSRNYYKDLVVYSMLKPVTDVSLTDVKNFGIDRVMDKLLGFIITAVTGVPAIADVKDAADVASSLVHASNNLATKINSFKPTQIGEELE